MPCIFLDTADDPSADLAKVEARLHPAEDMREGHPTSRFGESSQHIRAQTSLSNVGLMRYKRVVCSLNLSHIFRKCAFKYIDVRGNMKNCLFWNARYSKADVSGLGHIVVSPEYSLDSNQGSIKVKIVVHNDYPPDNPCCPSEFGFDFRFTRYEGSVIIAQDPKLFTARDDKSGPKTMREDGVPRQQPAKKSRSRNRAPRPAKGIPITIPGTVSAQRDSGWPNRSTRTSSRPVGRLVTPFPEPPLAGYPTSRIAQRISSSPTSSSANERPDTIIDFHERKRNQDSVPRQLNDSDFCDDSTQSIKQESPKVDQDSGYSSPTTEGSDLNFNEQEAAALKRAADARREKEELMARVKALRAERLAEEEEAELEKVKRELSLLKRKRGPQ